MPPEETWASEKMSKADLSYIFTLIDGDKDGKASWEELNNFHSHTAKSLAKSNFKMPAGVDENKDGKLSLEELKEANHKMGMSLPKVDSDAIKKEFEKEEAKFSLADADKDGFLDGDELLIFFEPDLDHDVSLMEAKFLFETLDEDKDGHVSKDEWKKARMPSTFRSVDTGIDGKIELHELHKWQSGLHEFVTSMLKVLAIADKDKDGALTLTELIDSRKQLHSQGSDHVLRSWADIHNEL